MDTRHISPTPARQSSLRHLRLRKHMPLFAVIISGVLLLTPVLVLFNGSAAGGFANPAFQSQWQQGEGVAPNFWGPLSLAKDGQQESYAEAVGGTRLVQYFDKARMELGANNTVTNGLLATELITGKRQLGDNTFQDFGPANVPIAGDSDNIGPTYASIQANAAQLRVVVSSTPGAAVTTGLSPNGAFQPFANGATFAQANIGGYDSVTQHNVPTAFLNYRNTAGVPAIGLAITEPFWSNVKVAGVQKDVLMQGFERRVLTFTPSNPAAFLVEFGNIGSHYFQWRYVTSPSGSGGTGTGTATTAPTVPTTAPTMPTATPMPAPTPAPTLSSIVVSEITTTGAKITYTTDIPACGTAEFRIAGTAAFTTDITTLTCPALSMSFTKVLTGLTPTKNYEVRGAAFTSPNSPSSIGYSSVAPLTTLTPDVTGALITNIVWTAVDNNNIKLTFKLNETGTAKVKFGPTADLMSATTTDATAAPGNIFSATFGVTREKQFFYQIAAIDASNNPSTTTVKQVQLNRTMSFDLKTITIKVNHFEPGVFPIFLDCRPAYVFTGTVRYASGVPDTKTINATFVPFAATVPKDNTINTTETLLEDASRNVLLSLSGSYSGLLAGAGFCTGNLAPANVTLTPVTDWSVNSTAITESADYKATWTVASFLIVIAP